jgi:hypothetical protein
MSAPWPPPPDLASIQELVRAADVERHLADGAASDEYEPEEKALFARISGFTTDQLLTSNLLPILEEVWKGSFHLDAEAMSQRRPALLSLAKEIERFFGPESKPRTRAEILEEHPSRP